MLLVNSTSHLHVPDDVAASFSDDEVGDAFNFNFYSRKFALDDEHGLVDYRDTLGYGLQSRLNSLVPRKGGNLNQFTERACVVEFMTLAKPAKNLIVSRGFRFLFSTVPKQDSAVADAWSVK